jgi:hypothetical protein
MVKWGHDRVWTIGPARRTLLDTPSHSRLISDKLAGKRLALFKIKKGEAERYYVG